MKKSLVIISCILLLMSITLTACGNSNILVDKYGYSHVVATDENGNWKQDKWGNLLVENTDSEGNKVTEPYDFPEKITDKHNKKIENAVVSINVPSGWSVSEVTSFVRLRHKGKCAKNSSNSSCQMDFTYSQNLTLQEVYNNYLANVVMLSSLDSDEITDIEEYEVTLMGKNAKAISYKISSTSTTVYYFVIDGGEPMIEITVHICGDCYDNASLVELISSGATIKELPTDDSVTITTQKFTKASENTEASNEID